jgi:conflict system pore-forming effector with SLATT domain
LAPSTPVEDERFVLESQVRELYARCAYTHKTHEKMAERASTYLWRVKWAQIILSALTTGGAIGVLFDKNSAFFPLATAALSISMVIVNSYVKDIDPGQDAQVHRDAASDIWNVREAYLSLLTDIRDQAFSLADLRARRDELQSELHAIYKGAPHTNSKAYGEAQDALQNREDLTFSEAEIDAFLPEPLKRKRETR